jgi:RNA polymerase sigma factor (sigma-70 family)
MAECTRKTLSAQVGDACARRLTIEEALARHERLVHAFIQRQGGGAIPYEDALQAGRIGLWRALKGYDTTRGTAFSTYAWVAIYRHIHRAAEELNRELGDWPGEILASWEEPDPGDWVEHKLVLEALWELVGRLPDRLHQVIVARYGLEGQPPRTLKAIGAEVGLTGERVRQLQQEALAWLRHPAHSLYLRQLLGRNTVADYRWALAKNAAQRRAQRGRR